MILVRRSDERGHADHGWLDTYHTFSFAGYYDPDFMGFRSLRVINQDKVAAGAGFGTHPHHDMEIVTYVTAGALEHKDSMGNGSVMRAGDVQRMTAGTGVTHSEFNHSESEEVRFLQIWIIPEQKGLEPSYEQKRFESSAKHNRLQPVASGRDAGGALKIHQDADMFASVLEPGESVTHDLGDGRYGWLQVISGDVTVNGETLHQGDGAAVAEESSLTIAAESKSEFLLFDLA